MTTINDSMNEQAVFDGYHAGADLMLLRPLVPADLTIFRNRH